MDKIITALGYKNVITEMSDKAISFFTQYDTRYITHFYDYFARIPSWHHKKKDFDVVWMMAVRCDFLAENSQKHNFSQKKPDYFRNIVW